VQLKRQPETYYNLYMEINVNVILYSVHVLKKQTREIFTQATFLKRLPR
jgi:hypothetical protein